MQRDSFSGLGLAEPLLRALTARAYSTPTPIQAQAIPHLLAGRDLLGIAQTGTGKTAAFALPMLQLLAAAQRRPVPKAPRALVLSPTRELAAQIYDSFVAYGRHLPLRHTVIFGGVGQAPQVHALQRGVDVLVATPGRLHDLIQQGHVTLRAVEYFVLDEADRMLDMGFIHDVKRVIRELPRDRQSLLFSATMPDDVSRLAHSILRDPVRVAVTPPASTVDLVAQRVHFVAKADKPALLAKLLADATIERALVFTRTKHGADKVARHLRKLNFQVEAIHGNKSQTARVKALDGFRDGDTRILVATDIAARGIDVPGITHVINFDLPNVPENYVHRIGRTARAGKSGMAISLCSAEEREFLRDIEKTIKLRVEVAGNGVAAPDARPGPPEAGRSEAPRRVPQPQPAPPERRGGPPPKHPAPQRQPVHTKHPQPKHPQPSRHPGSHPRPAPAHGPQPQRGGRHRSRRGRSSDAYPFRGPAR